MAEKKDKLYVEFSNKQVFNRRTIKSADDKDVTLVSISLPKSAEHSGFYVDVPAKHIHPSKYNSNMSYTTYLKNQSVPIYKYDKDTKEKEKIMLSAKDVKAEFSSWKSKSKDETSSSEYKQEQEELDEIDM